MKALYVLYDAECGLCTEVQDWLRRQPSYLDLQVLPSNSEAVQRRFPGLPSGELAVVSDSGEVWLGDNAFIVCLWALRNYRGWAQRFTSALLRPMARQAFEAVSHNRRNLSKLLGLKSEVELKKHLSEVDIPPCPTR